MCGRKRSETGESTEDGIKYRRILLLSIIMTTTDNRVNDVKENCRKQPKRVA
jgi:hypothetical protein